MKTHYVRSLAIFFILLSILLCLGVVLIPLLYEEILVAQSHEISVLDSDNMDIWAQFPGKLNSSLVNSFRFFSVKTIGSNEIEVELNQESMDIIENTCYTNFQFDAKFDQVTFLANRTFKKKTNDLMKQVNQISMGKLEMFEALTNPPLFQIGVNSLKYLFEKGFGKPEIFINKMFAVYSFDYVTRDKEKATTTILADLAKEKAYEILNNSQYGMASIKGYFKWIAMLGNDKLIENAQWTKTQFNLNLKEVKSIVGKQSYLFSFLTFYNMKIAAEFQCQSSLSCGYELFFSQLIRSSVTKSIGFDTIKQLNDYLDPTLYQFPYSPEMISYYSIFYTNSTELNFTKEYLEELSFSVGQLKSMLDDKKPTSVFEPENAISLLLMNNTDDPYAAYQKYGITSNKQLYFLNNYIFKFLKELFTYPTIQIDDKTTTPLLPIAKGFSSMIQILIDKSYGALRKNNDLHVIVISKIIEQVFKGEPEKDKCVAFMTYATGDNERAKNICSKDQINFKSYQSIKKWVLPFRCIDVKDCRVKEKEYLITATGLSEEMLKKVYEPQALGQYTSQAEEMLKASYNCSSICTEEYLAKLQYTSSYVTSHPPSLLKDIAFNTIQAWDEQAFPTPIELYYYQQKTNCPKEDCNAVSNEAIVSLYETLLGISLEENAVAYSNKFYLDSMYTLMLRNVTNSKYSQEIGVTNSTQFFIPIKKMLRELLFTATNIASYDPNSLLFGSKTEDEFYLQVLSTGTFFENFRPKIKSTTGFNIKLDSKDTSLIDTYTFNTGYDSTKETLRQISKINGLDVINSKRLWYSPKAGNYVVNTIPLHNMTKLNSFVSSDGFQFLVDRERIYYYDHISTSVFEFNYHKKTSYQGLECYEYTLSNNLTTMFTDVSQIFNKPMLISRPNAFYSREMKKFYPLKIVSNIQEEGDKNNYICVDMFSNMVIQSNITLVYSTYTENFNQLDEDFKPNAIYPMMYFNKYFEIDSKTYHEVFPGVQGYLNSKLAILIVGLLIVLALLILGIWFCVNLRKVHDTTNYSRVPE